jgi:hypothetical protein
MLNKAGGRPLNLGARCGRTDRISQRSRCSSTPIDLLATVWASSTSGHAKVLPLAPLLHNSPAKCGQTGGGLAVPTGGVEELLPPTDYQRVSPQVENLYLSGEDVVEKVHAS